MTQTTRRPFLPPRWFIRAAWAVHRAIYRLNREDFRRTRDELIELLDIGDLVRKPVRQLSLGERMKVEVAGSLLHLPQVLYLDEPTANLDIHSGGLVRRTLRELVAQGCTVLLTTHKMEEVEEVCDRVAIMQNGSIVEEGPTAQVVSAPASPYTVELLAAVPRLRAEAGQ